MSAAIPAGEARTVAVVGGGTSAEHEVSLGSAAGVVAALAEAGHHPVALTIAPDGSWRTGTGDPLGLDAVVRLLGAVDVVLPMLHGRGGEDGTLAALCELVGVPYVGTPLVGSAIGMDKWASKLVARELGIRVADAVLLTRDAAVPSWPDPVVVKPVGAGSSRGVTLVRRPEELPAALEAAFALDERVLVEEVVVGREVDLAVLGRADGSRLVPPALEIATEGFFDYEAKYGGGARFLVPAPLDDVAARRLRAAAIAMYDALGCRGVARIDFFLTDDGEPVFNEINTIPGFTAASQVPRMFAAAGIDYPQLVDLLVTEALSAAPGGTRHGVLAPLPA